MASTSTGFTRARGLNAVKTLAGHEPYFDCTPDGKRIEPSWGPAMSYFPDGQKMISGYHDKTVRLWDLQAGKEIEEMRVVCEWEVFRVAVSRDSRWVIAACWEGKLKVCEVGTGVVKTFDGHSSASGIASIDISRDSKLLVSGSWDGTTRIWDLEIGNLVASTPTSSSPLAAVRFSQDSKKLAVMSTNHLDVWDFEACQGKLHMKVRKIYHIGMTNPRVPVFWTTKDRTIVATICLHSRDIEAKTIYEIDSSTLEIVGPPFEGHTGYIRSLDLSPDCTLLVSASFDNAIKLWALESRQILAEFDVRGVYNIVLSPNTRQLAYTIGKPGRRKIYICDIPPDVVAEPTEKAPGSNARRNSDPLNSDATAHRAAAQCNPVPARFATRPLGRSPAIHQQEFSALRYLRKLLPTSFRRDDICTVELRDPLDCPATSPRLPSQSSPVPITNLMRSNSRENSGHMPPISQPATLASSSTSRLRHLFNWHPARTGHALSPTIDVPLAHGQTRHAAAGAPRRGDRCVPDEDIDSRPSSPNSDPQGAPPEEHRSGPLCFCF